MDSFFTDLKSFSEIDEICNGLNYVAVPEDWVLVLTDVMSSTKAIEDGRYKEVNIAGVSSIISTKNALGDFDFPYVFGGDGATFLIPKKFVQLAKAALSFTRQTVKDQFDLRLRVGFVDVSEIYAQKFELVVAKLKLSEGNYIAQFQGSGFVAAENWVKKTEKYELSLEHPPSGFHEGLECRWNPIPSSQGEIMTLIIQKMDPAESNDVFFSKLIQKMKIIVPQFKLVTAEKIPRTWPPKNLKQELKMKNKSALLIDIKYYLILGVTYFFSKLVKNAKSSDNSKVSKYLDQFAANTDFLKFDDTLKMVIDVTAEQKQQLLTLLDEEQKLKKLIYGAHFSHEALVTCFIRSLSNHIHFIDGGSGGYALAAKQLKQKKSITISNQV